jgi:hypothetical protein
MTEDRITVRVASPCTESWEKMEGDERQRFCARCQLNVYSLSALTIGELEALVQRTEGRLCGRIYQRGDGTALTRDCPVGLRRARVRLAAGLTMAAALVCAIFLAAPPRTSGPSASFGERVSHWKDKARDLPVIGFLIELVDPSPIVGAIVISLPPGRP